jgi:hypothetical protein
MISVHTYTVYVERKYESAFNNPFFSVGISCLDTIRLISLS